MRILLHFLRGRPEVALLFAILTVDLVWCRHVHLAFLNLGIALALISGLLLLALTYGYSGRSKRISDMGYYSALFVCSGALMMVMSYLAAYRGSALCDGALSQFDVLLGFDWRRWAAFLRSHPVFDTSLKIAYDSLLPQIWLTIFLLAHVDREDRNKEFFWTILVSSLATVAVFYLFPAAGPFVYYHLDLDRAIHLRDLQALRAGAGHAYSLPRLQGIIAFPSYHTVLALIIPYVHRGLSRSFLPFLVLNVLMLVSTPSHGGHYLTDLLGGCAIAAGSIALVRYATMQAHGRQVLGPAVLENAAS